MLLKNIDIYVYKIDNETFDAIGQINKYTSLMWPDKYNGYTSFELHVPVTQENSILIKKGNVLWCGDDNAAVIEIIKADTDKDGQKTFTVKGRTLEVLLTRRIIWGTYNCVNKYSSTVMYEIVNNQCVNPSSPFRKIPFLECAEDKQNGKKISFQRTGGEVYDALTSIATDADLGFDVLFRPEEKKFIFQVTEGVDRTDSVIFSTDLEDILTSSYYTNDQDIKTLAYVAGEGEGADRKYIISGDNDSRGFERRELYVDARDLQTQIADDDGNITTVTDEEYNNLLNDRGAGKLAECITVETFEAKMRVIGDIQYVYGVDYTKGDKVLIQDVELGVQVVARITEVSENIDDEYELLMTFGYEYPTLIQKVKQQMTN